MKSSILSALRVLLLLMLAPACNQSFLEIYPFTSVNEATLSTKEGVNGLLIGAYSLLDGGGAVGGGTASRLSVFTGTDDGRTGEEAGVNALNAFLTDPSMAQFNNRWSFLYSAVQRCNDVLKILPKVESITAEEALQIEAEARFLRGIYYLYLVMHWKKCPLDRRDHQLFERKLLCNKYRPGLS